METIDDEIADITLSLYENRFESDDAQVIKTAAIKVKAAGLSLPNAYTLVFGIRACEEWYQKHRHWYDYYKESANDMRVRGVGVKTGFPAVAERRNTVNRSAHTARVNQLFLCYSVLSKERGFTFKDAIYPLLHAIPGKSFQENSGVDEEDFCHRKYKTITERIYEYKNKHADLELEIQYALSFFNQIQSTVFE